MFLDNVAWCVNTQGGGLYDASLGDEELIEQMFEEAVEENSSKRKKADKPAMETRPSRRGYTRQVEALYDVKDSIVGLRAELGKWPVTTTERVVAKRPWFPSEVVQERMRQRNVSKRDEKIRAAQQLGAQMMAAQNDKSS